MSGKKNIPEGRDADMSQASLVGRHHWRIDVVDRPALCGAMVVAHAMRW